MSKRATPRDVAGYLKELGLAANPIEHVIYHRDGSATIWVTGLDAPVALPAPAPAARKPSSRGLQPE